MKYSFEDAICELKINNLHTKKLDKLLKEIFKLSKDGIKSLKIDRLSNDEIAALNYLGYTVEWYGTDDQPASEKYYVITGLF